MSVMHKPIRLSRLVRQFSSTCYHAQRQKAIVYDDQEALTFNPATIDEDLKKTDGKRQRRDFREGKIDFNSMHAQHKTLYIPPVVSNPLSKRLIPIVRKRQKKRPQPPANFFDEDNGLRIEIGSDKVQKIVADEYAEREAFYDNCDPELVARTWQPKGGRDAEVERVPVKTWLGNLVNQPVGEVPNRWMKEFKDVPEASLKDNVAGQALTAKMRVDTEVKVVTEEAEVEGTDTHLGYLASMTRSAFRWETHMPTSKQLNAASALFTEKPATFIMSNARFADLPPATAPEVVLVGRSNVGKSSLVNALIGGHKQARESSKPGHTRLLNMYNVGEGKLTLLDSPGYGFRSRPEWGDQMIEYLQSRKQLRRCFIVVDPAHGPKISDRMMMQLFNDRGVPYQVVFSKCDKLHIRQAPGRKLPSPQLKEAFSKMRKTLLVLSNEVNDGKFSGLGEVIATCAGPDKGTQHRFGIDDLRWAMMVAAGLEVSP